MISTIYKEIYECGKQSKEIKNLNVHSIRGLSRYIQIFYLAGQYRVENLGLMHLFTMLMIDFDELSHLDQFEKRYLEIINAIKIRSEFMVMKKVINDISIENSLVYKLKNVLLEFLLQEIIKREI